MIADLMISGPEELFSRIPFAQFLNLRMEMAGNELTTILPFAPHLIGNPLLPALHGGTIGAFLELTATAQLSVFETFDQIPKPVNVSVQYLRSGKPIDTYARARINRVGRTIANVEAWAWQELREQPIATLQAHFLIC
ncbi:MULTISPECIES: PaaI family thioesterase [Asticcacaulis]|jgi:acyl-coenzyme A thioesterase PaaI-like protein|uniref:Thioesterase family protein n=1 Tax=Asticcacaulis excentricus TaxID=78587 RepID=A0A3G9G9P0_9CAUL|nr:MULTISPECIES: PaaI family thioesterase [Asticcacaulis]MCA1933926.1 PaaI family thioesterase [Asticcacaulis sp.]BBF82003.1 thioesterase family protein [Asticcacaulis excentricus]